VVEELTGTAVSRTYAYGLQRISQTQSGTTSFYGYDGFASVRALTDSAGTVTDTYDYDAWGNNINTTGSTANVYLYRGEQYDSDLKLYYLRARYLNPLSGRFLTRDPKPGVPLRPQRWHRYLYAQADPVNRIDPTGLNDLEEGALQDGQISTYGNQVSRANVYGRNGLESHHIIPKRFACLVALTVTQMLAIALPPGIHQGYDNLWNRAIPPDGEPCDVELSTVANVARAIYASEPDMLAIIENMIKQWIDMGLM
jgi:RHS repeat-associated protein